MKRRGFIKRVSALALGGVSASAGLFALFKGKRIEPFLETDSAALLEQFGPGITLVNALDIPEHEKLACARHVMKIKKKLDASAQKGKAAFYRAIRHSAEVDYGKDRVVMVGGWVVSRTEIGVYLYNKYKRRGLV